MSDFILTNLPCSGRILIVADAVTEQAVCTSGSVVEYRLAKARVAGFVLHAYCIQTVYIFNTVNALDKR